MDHVEKKKSMTANLLIFAREKSKVGALILFLLILFKEVNPLNYNETMDDIPPNTNRIIWSLICLFAFYGVLYLPETFIKRPSPVFWKAIQGVGFFYLVMIVGFLCLVIKIDLNQSRNYLFSILRLFFDEKLGVPLPEKTYAADCRIYTPENAESNFFNVMESVDFYIYVHLIGWYFKMIIVRDWKFCQFLSIFFEFLEITFAHWLPNFNECWFDHCNLVDLSNFFNKFVLWIPSDHGILQFRIFLWGFMSIAAGREYYDYINDKTNKTFGPFVWLCHAILAVEAMILFKFSKGFFIEPFPQWIIYTWVGIFISLGIFITALAKKEFIKSLANKIN